MEVFAAAVSHRSLTSWYDENWVEITYDAVGNKLTKNNSFGEVKNYVAGIEYNGNNLEAIYHSEGRLTPNASTYRYEYTLIDHLGNSRVFFSDTNADNVADILQENHYYPFGMDLESNYFAGQVGTEGAYKYNGKELNEDFGLNWYDYGARWYMPYIGRWGQVDKLADEPEQIDKSPYAYGWNNPTNLTDPDGNCPNCGTAIIGAVVGGIVGGGIELGKQLWNNGKVTNWSAVKGSSLQGAITGGAAGFTGGASLVTTLSVAGTANAVGGTVNRGIQGQETTAGDILVDATVGAGLGAVGSAAGNIVKGVSDDLSRAAKGKLGEAITEIKYGAKGYTSGGKAVVETGKRTATGRVEVAKYDHAMTNKITGKQLTVESKFNGSTLTPNQAAAQSNVKTPGGLIIDRTTSQQLGNTAKAATIGAGAGVGAQRNKNH